MEFKLLYSMQDKLGLKSKSKKWLIIVECEKNRLIGQCFTSYINSSSYIVDQAWENKLITVECEENNRQ